MNRRRKITEKTVTSARARLFELSLKVRGIGYLLENQKEDDCQPLDIHEAHEGIGLLVQSLAKEARRIWQILDAWEVRKKAE